MYKIFINKKEDKINLFVKKNDELVEQYEEPIEKQRLEGNVYIGKVDNVVEGMQAAFVDIGIEKKALIHIEDIIPKESEVYGNSNINIAKYKINDYIKPNDLIIVQIQKDCYNQKGPRATKHIKLTGNYVVLMPFSKFITVSKKIEDETERNRLINIVEKLNKKYGIIIRTSCVGVDEDKIEEDIQKLISLWKDILKKSKQKNKPSLLYDNNGIIGKLITDFQPLGLEVITNSDEIKKKIENQNVKVTLDEKFNDEVENERKIWLKSGAYITIDRTEALIAIDVNTGKYIGKRNIEKTLLSVNIEAANEIAKQIILQDLGGIIIIDFIDMFSDDDREKVKECMIKELKKDRSQVNVLEFTKLGLLEITRKNILGK